MEAAEVAGIVEVPEVALLPEQALLQVKMVGMCGTDLNTYRGRNAMVTFPRVLGHEIAAVVVEGDGDLPAGTPVTMAPYTNCGICPACLRGRVNACQRNDTMGVQRDGAITEYIRVPRAKLYPAKFVDQGPLPGRAADGWIPRGGTRASELRVCDRSFPLRLRLRRRGAGSHLRLGILRRRDDCHRHGRPQACDGEAGRSQACDQHGAGGPAYATAGDHLWSRTGCHNRGNRVADNLSPQR